MVQIYDEEPDYAKHIFRIVIILILIITFFSTLYVIDSGSEGVLMTFGKADTTPRYAGLHLKIPYLQNIVTFNMRTLKYEADAKSASKDLQDVDTKVALNFHLKPSMSPIVFTNIGVNYPDVVISPAIQEVVKSVTAEYTAEELITKRTQVRQEISKRLQERLDSRNIVSEELSITNFEFSPSFTQAIERKVTAEQKALEEQNNLKVEEYKAQQKIIEAKGNAEAVRIINQELLKSPQYVNYLTIQRWDGHMPLALGSGSLLSINGVNNS